jgi:tetratricopeptide (TPR) repeat protein
MMVNKAKQGPKQNNLPDQLLNASLQHHQAGRLREAAEGYKSILQKNPQHSDALHLLGVIFQQQGQFDLAIQLIKAAIAQNPSLAHYHHNLGNTYLQSKHPAEAAEAYRQAILLKPNYYEAHNGFGNALTELKLTDAAIGAYHRAVKLNPSFAEAHYNLGRSLAEANRNQEAIESYRAAIRLDNKRSEYFFNLGGLFFKEKNYAEAIRHYQATLQLQPDDAEALCNLGASYVAYGDKQLGEDYLRKAITTQPNYALARLHLGALCFVTKREEEAQASYEQALKLNPALAEAHWGLGNLQFAKSQFAEAEKYFRDALKYKPDYPECLNNLGQTLLELDRPDETIDLYRKAVEFNPNYAEAHCNLGAMRLKKKDFVAAEQCFRRCLEIKPNFREAIFNLGNTFKEQRRYTEAVKHYKEVLNLFSQPEDETKTDFPALSPILESASNNLGLCLLSVGQTAEAIAVYRSALANFPENAMMQGNFAIALLKSGQLVEGWERMEWRWKIPGFPSERRDFGRPLWNGESLHDAKIFLTIEQGCGDVLQFVRYIPLVLERGGRIILESPPALCRLLSRMAGIEKIVTTGNTLPDFSYQCPLMSLPWVFKTTLDTIPASIPYLTVPEEEMETARNQWPGDGLRVGLVWSGNPKHFADAHRSMNLEDMLPLCEVPGASFYSLQVGSRSEQLANVPASIQIKDVCSRYTDYADTAAFIAGLDLVITVDTSVAHLTGALGIPVWILLAHEHLDWRWLRDRNDSPWYPSARLFGQSQSGNWAEVITEVKTALQDLSAQYKATS